MSQNCISYLMPGQKNLLKIGFAPPIQTRISLGWIVLMLLFLAGCGQTETETLPGVVYREETVVLPTGAPTSKPTPVSTRVVPVEVFTSGLTLTVTPIPDEVRGLVVEVIDGDTVVVILDGDPPGRTYQVRYLGIDAPPNAASVPWGMVAFEVNRRLTSGKVVRLERDQSDTDADGRLLRYVYVGDEMLSIILAEQGLARTNVEEPDTRFRAEILEAEEQARDNGLGLWGPPPTPTPRATATGTAVITSTVTVTATATVASEATAMVEPEVTGETPLGSPSPTPAEPEATATETSADTPEAMETPILADTPEATIEPTLGSDSDNEGLQGPQ